MSSDITNPTNIVIRIYCKYRQHNPLYPLRVGTIHFFVFSRELKFSNWHRLQNPRFIVFSRKSCRLKRRRRFGRSFAKKCNFFPFIVDWKYCYYYFFPLGEKHPFFSLVLNHRTKGNVCNKICIVLLNNIVFTEDDVDKTHCAKSIIFF